MASITITEKGGKPLVRDFNQPEITIGRVQGNDIVLPKSNISKRHARIVAQGAGFSVIDAKSTNGTYVNGKRLSGPHELRPGDKVFVGDFTLEVRPSAEAGAPAPARSGPPASPPRAESREQKTRELSDLEEHMPDAPWGEQAGEGGEGAAAAEEDWGNDWQEEGAAPEAEPVDLGDEVPMESPEPMPETPAPARMPREASGHRGQQRDEPAHALRLVHERLAHSVDMRNPAQRDMSDDQLRSQTTQAVQGIVANMQATGEIPMEMQAGALVNLALDEAVGFGPLDELLADPTITEILVNNARQIFVERAGQLEPSGVTFSSDQAVLNIIEKIVAPLGRHVDERTPMVDARLRDGSRVNAIIPPLSIRGPTLTIRKFAREPLQIDDLVAGGCLNADMAEFFEVCVQARKNVIISGGTGSGKTTLLNVLSSFVDSSERILTIEDAAELKLDQEHVVALEARPADANGEGAVQIRDLVRNALRMRPDRIIVGECRGGEAFDMLQAMNTGHDGSLTTVHANSPRDALTRLETMVLMSGMELPVRAIREQVASAVDIIIQVARFSDGTRRITHISEIVGMEVDVTSMHDLFVFDQRGIGQDGRVHGRFKATGFVPKFYDGLRALGIEPNLAIFRNT